MGSTVSMGVTSMKGIVKMRATAMNRRSFMA
jgi:hypothetical protein